MNGYYALISENSITIHSLSPEMRLALSVNGDRSYYTNAYAIYCLKDNSNALLNTLSEREQKVLTLRLGFDNHTPMSLETVGSKFGTTRENIRRIEAKALRKARNSSLSKRLKGEERKSFHKCSYDNLLLKERLYQEVINYHLQGHQSGTLLLNILKKNDINLSKEANDWISVKNADGIELSVRTYNYLKHAGFNDIEEATIAVNNGCSLTHLDSNDRESLLRIIHEYEMQKFQDDVTEGLITLSLTIDGNTTIYKYYQKDENKILWEIVNDMTKSRYDSCSIFESGLSSKLIDSLLRCGYLYVEDVISDYKNKRIALTSSDIEKYIDEIEDIINYFNLSYQKIYIVYDESIIQLIFDKNKKDFSALVDEVRRIGNKELLEIVRDAEEYLFPRKEH